MRTISKLNSAIVLCFFGSMAFSHGALAVDRRNNGNVISMDSSCNVTRFYGVPIELTVSMLKRLPLPARIAREMGEGETFITAKIKAERGVEIKVEFDANKKLELLKTTSPNAVDLRGIRPGSSLSDVEAAWPNGKLYYGAADGRYVRYITGTNVIYTFDPDDMDPQAFDPSGKEVVVPNLKVVAIEIRSAPVPVAGR